MTKLLILFTLLLSMTAFAQQHPRPVTLTPESVFVPNGFDNNDNVQVIVFGHTYSSCMKLNSTTAAVIGNQVHLRVLATKETSPKCLDVVSEYFKVLDLGQLSASTYDIVLDNEESFVKISNLEVAPSKSSQADDYSYANVTEAEMTANNDGTHTLVLRGTYPDSCTNIAEVKTEYRDGVLVVLPLLKTEFNCLPQIRNFEYTMTIKAELKAGANLVHVRSHDGQAVNSRFINE